MTDNTDDDHSVSRRDVLRTGAMTAGAVGLVTGGSGSASALVVAGPDSSSDTRTDDDHGTGDGRSNDDTGTADSSGTDDDGSDEKRGGRGQVDGDPERNRPFRLSSGPSKISRHASCMAEESAQQTYLGYDIEYCDEDDSEDTLYVIPDEATLARSEVYEFRAIQPCTATENELVAFGPSDQDC